MSATAFDGLVLRVAAERRQRGDLDAAFLDAVAVVQGTEGLARLVSWLHEQGGLPGVLAGLAERLDSGGGARAVTAAVALLADREAGQAQAVQLERARRHLGLLAGLPASRRSDVSAEVEQLAQDLVAGRELL